MARTKKGIYIKIRVKKESLGETIGGAIKVVIKEVRFKAD
jgi:hypothetical protein